MKLAAIDIGSNAVRLQISRLLHPEGVERFKRVEYIRFPLKLGNDAFKQQRITLASEQKLLQLLHAFKLLIDLYAVEDYMICATSALREADNRLEVVAHIQQALGLSVNLINGQQEAELIEKAILPLLEDQDYLHVDVGGGSTEVSIYVQHTKIASHSFSLGTLKILEGCDHPASWRALDEWIHTQTQQLNGPLLGIATGGNIRKIAQLVRRGGRKLLAVKTLQEVQEQLSAYSVEDRIHKLALNPDRADVIVPAAQIYLATMRAGNVKEIFVPEISLRDGIIQWLYEKNSKVLRSHANRLAS